jgi:hypothetical protein
MKTMTAVVSLALGAALLAPGPDSRAADAEPILHLRAFAVDLNNGSRTGTIDIVIERWSTAEEIEKLQAISVESGDDRMLEALRKIRPRCGYARAETSLGWDVYMAQQAPLPGGGQKIVVATDRPVSFWELRNPTRLNEYKFSLAEVRLGSDGKGEGKAIPFAQLRWNPDTKTFEVENYQQLPVRLSQVTIVDSKRAAR